MGYLNKRFQETELKSWGYKHRYPKLTCTLRGVIIINIYIMTHLNTTFTLHHMEVLTVVLQRFIFKKVSMGEMHSDL